MSLAAAIAAIADVCETVPGVVYTPDTPPAVLTEYQLPAILIIPLRGEGELETFTGGNGLPVERRRVTLLIQLHLAYETKALDTATVLALSMHEPLSKKLWRGFIDDQFNGTVTLMGSETTPPIRWTYQVMTGFGRQTIGFQYELDLTVMEDIPA